MENPNRFYCGACDDFHAKNDCMVTAPKPETIPTVDPGVYHPTHEPAAISSGTFADVQNHASEERAEATDDSVTCKVETYGQINQPMPQLAPDFVLSNSEAYDIVINSILVEFCATPTTRNQAEKAPTDIKRTLSIDNVTFRPREGITGADVTIARDGLDGWIDKVTSSDGIIRQVVVTIQGVTFSCDTEWLMMLRDPAFRDAAIKQVKESFENQEKENATEDDAVSLAIEDISGNDDDEEDE